MDESSVTQDPPAQATSSKRDTEPRHGWRMIAIWAVLSAIADPIFYYVVGPHVPPGIDDLDRERGAVRLQRAVHPRLARAHCDLGLHGLRDRRLAGEQGRA